MEFPCSAKKSVKKKVKPRHPNQKGKNRNLKEYLILRHMHQSASIDPLKTRSPESDRYGINGLHTGSILHPNFFRSIAHYTSLYVSSFRSRSVGLNILHSGSERVGWRQARVGEIPCKLLRGVKRNAPGWKCGAIRNLSGRPFCVAEKMRQISAVPCQMTQSANLVVLFLWAQNSSISIIPLAHRSTWSTRNWNSN